MALTSEINAGTAHAAYANVKETFPESTAATSGTISILIGDLKKVVGVGTVFLTDFNVGDYIWITTADDLRRISSIASDTEMTLQFPATVAAADTFRKIKPIGYYTVSWANDITGVSNINKIPFAAGLSATYDGTIARKVILIDSTVSGGTVNVIAE